MFQIYLYCISGKTEQREANGSTQHRNDGKQATPDQPGKPENEHQKMPEEPKVSQPRVQDLPTQVIPVPRDHQSLPFPSVPQPTGQAGPPTGQPGPPAQPFSIPPPTRGFDIGMFAALAGVGGAGGPHHPGFGPEVQAQMQRQMAELLAAGSAHRMPAPAEHQEPVRTEHVEVRQVRKESPPQFDLSALAAMSGQGSVGPVGGPQIVGAINAEDLEASFHTESSQGNNSCDDSGSGREERSGDNVERQASRPPPGFGGQQQLQEILGQIGNMGPKMAPVGPIPGLLQHQMMQRHLQQMEQEQLRHGGVVPGGITAEQLRKGGILPEQLRAGGILPEQLRTGAILPEQLRAGGIMPEQLQAGGILPGQLRPPMMAGGMLPGFGFQQDLRQRQLSGDPLGIQSLANMVPMEHQGQGSPNSFGPMMLPMIPFGLPQMGMFPFGGQNPAVPQMNPMGLMRGGFPPGGLPPTPARESPNNSPHPPETTAPPLQTGWPTMFGPLSAGPSVPPFTHRETGFPSSVLFPGDLKHPLLHPATPPLEHYLDQRSSLLPTNASNPLPIPPTSKPITPDVLLAEGSPMTPPNLNLHTFNFDD